MNSYHRFLSILQREFQRKAQPEIRCLWADLMELEEAIDEPTVTKARQQALRRIFILGRAAGAANARDVCSHSGALEVRLGALTQARAAARPGLFERANESMRDLTEAFCAIDPATLRQDPTDEATERLREICAN